MIHGISPLTGFMSGLSKWFVKVVCMHMINKGKGR